MNHLHNPLYRPASRDTLVDYLWIFFRGKSAAAGSQTGPQFFLDVVELLKNGAHKNLDNVDIQWIFSKGDPDVIVNEIMRKVMSDKSALIGIMRASGDSTLNGIAGNTEKLNAFILQEFSPLLKAMIINGKKVQ